MAEIAVRPECQPLVDAVYAYLEARKLRIGELCEMLYGRDAQGKVRGAGQVYGVLRGRDIPSPEKAALWKEKGGPDLVTLAAQLDDLSRSASHAEPKSSAVTPVKAAVVAFERATKRSPKKAPAPRPVMKPEPKPEPRAEPPQFQPPLFAMTIDQGGRANLTLNMVAVDSAEALRAVALLQGANLIKVGSS